MKIRKATKSDIEAMVALSHIKRKAYEQAQPQFWKYAAGAEIVQSRWFTDLLTRDDHILLVAEASSIKGFIIGRLCPAPEVYDPGGLTLMIDDFCVQNSDWEKIGSALIDAIKSLGKENGAVQILVVSGAHDKEKLDFLIAKGLSCASHWYVGEIK